MSKHTNNGACEYCLSIINKYLGFYPPLLSWFKTFQIANPACHASCGGRNEADQEALYLKGATKAHWQHSAHNWNAAIDLFEQQGDLSNIYEESWFHEVLEPALPDWINWLGKPGCSFPELPHIEVKDFRNMSQNGQLHLVGEGSESITIAVTSCSGADGKVTTTTTQVVPAPVQDPNVVMIPTVFSSVPASQEVTKPVNVVPISADTIKTPTKSNTLCSFLAKLFVKKN